MSEPEKPTLLRGLGPLDVTLLTIGGVVGTGIFLVPGFLANAVPHPTLILLIWAPRESLAGLVMIAAGLPAYAAWRRAARARG